MSVFVPGISAGRKLWAAVANYLEGEPVEMENLAFVDVSHSFCRDSGYAGEGVDHLAEMVGEHNN